MSINLNELSIMYDYCKKILALQGEEIDWTCLDDSEEDIDEVRFILREYFPNLTCDYGASKLVFLSNDFPNWVIKIPFTASSEYDYCAIEADIYATAVDDNLEEFFAEEYPVEFGDFVFYIQRRAKVSDSIVYSALNSGIRSWILDEDTDTIIETEEDLRQAVSSCYMSKNDSDNVKYLFYASPKYEELEEFLYKYEVNDLHEGNFGTIDGRMVMIDYSGFYSF